MKESELQASIVSALRFKGYLVYANNQNTRATSFEKGKEIKDTYRMHAHYKRIGWMGGIPDLTVKGTESNGHRIKLYIECKSSRGKLTDGQKDMMQMLEVQGEEVRVVRSLDDIGDLLDKDIIRTETLLLYREKRYS